VVQEVTERRSLIFCICPSYTCALIESALPEDAVSAVLKRGKLRRTKDQASLKLRRANGSSAHAGDQVRHGDAEADEADEGGGDGADGELQFPELALEADFFLVGNGKRLGGDCT